MIEVFGLKKNYGRIAALKGVSFSVPEGVLAGFLGANGAGKTTVLRILSTFLTPSGGSVKIAGHDLRTQASQVRSLIGFLPDTPPLYPELTVEEQLRFQGRLRGINARGELNDALARVSEFCELADVRKRLCGNLSKGYRQRVGLAQAILHDPQVLILDEPTSGLDPIQVRELHELLRRLAKEKTVLLSTHILSEAHSLCNQIIILRQGQIALNQAVDHRLDIQLIIEQEFYAGVIRRDEAKSQGKKRAGGMK